MTSHELADKLLSFPDTAVCVRDEDGYDFLATDVHAHENAKDVLLMVEYSSE